MSVDGVGRRTVALGGRNALTGDRVDPLPWLSGFDQKRVFWTRPGKTNWFSHDGTPIDVRSSPVGKACSVEAAAGGEILPWNAKDTSCDDVMGTPGQSRRCAKDGVFESGTRFRLTILDQKWIPKCRYIALQGVQKVITKASLLIPTAQVHNIRCS
jgi:hypothetical protein